MSFNRIAKFDIFDVDIGADFTRPYIGATDWIPTDKARVTVNEYDHNPLRLVGAWTPPDYINAEFMRETGTKADVGGRKARERMVRLFNKTGQRSRLQPQWAQLYADHFKDVAQLEPEMVYELVYPVRMVNGAPVYCQHFVQRISLEFKNDDFAFAAKVILDPLDKS